MLSEKCQEVGRVYVDAQNGPTVEDTGDFHPRKPVPSSLFLTPSSLLVCCVSKDVTAAVASKFAQKVSWHQTALLAALLNLVLNPMEIIELVSPE